MRRLTALRLTTDVSLMGLAMAFFWLGSTYTGISAFGFILVGCVLMAIPMFAETLMMSRRRYL